MILNENSIADLEMAKSDEMRLADLLRGTMSKKDRIAAIRNAGTHFELDAIVSAYLAELGEVEDLSESYAETSARLGGDEILDAAERRWFELWP